MKYLYLSEIRRDGDLSAELCDQLPADSRVLFSMRGRIDPGLVANFMRAALDARIAKELSAEDRVRLADCRPFNGAAEPAKPFKLLRRIADKDFRKQANAICGELSANAFRYGLDAIRAVRSAAEDEVQPRRATIHATTSMLDANSYGALLLTYSPAENIACVISQNYVTEKAAAMLAERLHQVNAGMLDPARPPLPREAPNRTADLSLQPLLAPGGPIDSVSHPLGLCDEPFLYQSGRTGLSVRVQSLAGESGLPLLFDHQPADLTTLQEPVLADVAEAVETARGMLELPAEAVRSFTIGVRVPVTARP